jgi:hypothetical protein
MVTTQQANKLITWLQQNKDEWFYMRLISGNNLADTCSVYLHEVKRMSDVGVSRIPLVNKFQVSFTVEVRSQIDYQAYNTAARPTKQVDYPSSLPLPSASGFTGNIGPLGVTTYQLTYRMNTAKLKEWLKFAGQLGTAWFKTKMVSPSTPCGTEMIRFTGDIGQSLVGPDLWEVNVVAESLPSFIKGV